MTKNTYFTMKEACRRLGISSRTLILKEQRGEIPKIRRDPKNNYRLFTEEDILKLKLILGRTR